MSSVKETESKAINEAILSAVKRLESAKTSTPTGQSYRSVSAFAVTQLVQDILEPRAIGVTSRQVANRLGRLSSGRDSEIVRTGGYHGRNITYGTKAVRDRELEKMSRELDESFKTSRHNVQPAWKFAIFVECPDCLAAGDGELCWNVDGDENVPTHNSRVKRVLEFLNQVEFPLDPL